MPTAQTPCLVIRRLRLSDAPLIHAAFKSLSMESRHLRYGLPATDTARALQWIADLDGRANAAVGAVHLRDGSLVAGARYATADGGTHAEVAVAVTDAWQGLGLGPTLLAELVEHAWRSGVTQLRASVLPGNTRALHTLSSAGDWRPLSRRGGLVEYSLAAPTPDGPDSLLIARPACSITYTCP